MALGSGEPAVWVGLIGLDDIAEKLRLVFAPKTCKELPGAPSAAEQRFAGKTLKIL